MEKIVAISLADPILLITSAVFLVTVGILIWAMNSWRNLSLLSPLRNDDEELTEEARQEDTGVLGAQIHEMSAQLSEISKGLAEMERKSEKKSFDPAALVADASDPQMTSVELERLVKRLESKIEALSAEKSQISSETITRIESRLDGIQRLLILLTGGDSGGPAK